MANEAMKRRLNDDAWAKAWPKREVLTDHITPFLLDALALRDGERVLDIGCGTGRTSVAAGHAVGSAGTVVGVDISSPMVALAKQRARDASAANVAFVLADAQTDRMGDGDYDVATSQLGIMFFDDAVAAFSNIGSHLRPGGRLVFACWQPIDKNPSSLDPILAPYMPSAPPPAEGRSAVGPYALADPAVVEALLTEAGFADVVVAPRDIVVEEPADALYDDELLAFRGVDAADLDDARAAIGRHLAKFGDPRGQCRFPLGFHIVSGRRP